MAEFRKLIITTAGFDFLTQAVKDNTAIAFSGVVLAAQNYTDEEIPALTALTEPVQTITNLGIVKPSLETIQITAMVSNSAAETGYSYSSIGLFAKNANDEEALFAVSGSNSPGIIPPNTSLFSARLELLLTISNAEQIAFTVDDKIISGTHGIYVGGGDMPEGYDVQIDPTGEALLLDNAMSDTSENVPKTKVVKAYVDKTAKELLNTVYPVGSIYLSVNSANPSTLFGGTWERLKDRFLLGAGDSYAAGAVGGEAEHTLSVNELPSHNHQITPIIKNSSGDSMTTNGYTIVHASDNLLAPNQTLTASTLYGGYSGNTGGGQAHNNMPPYLAVYMWKRTA